MEMICPRLQSIYSSIANRAPSFYEKEHVSVFLKQELSYASRGYQPRLFTYSETDEKIVR